MKDYPSAIVKRDDNGTLVCDDPVAASVIRAVEKHNCQQTLNTQSDRVEYFINRAKEKKLLPEEVMIVLANVDSFLGEVLADLLMPGFNWDEIRQRGETPFARGLASRDGVQKFVDMVDEEEGAKLRDCDDFPVVVADFEVVAVFSASDIQ
jgi:hypothetical protein